MHIASLVPAVAKSFHAIARTKKMKHPLGSKDANEDNFALEFLDLLGQIIVIEKVLNFNNDTICSLFAQCQKAEEDTVPIHTQNMDMPPPDLIGNQSRKRCIHK